MGKKISISNMLLVSREQNTKTIKKNLSFAIVFIALVFEVIGYCIVYPQIKAQHIEHPLSIQYSM